LGAQKLSAEGTRIEASKAPRGVGIVAGSQTDYGVWGSVVSSPIGVRGGAPAANAFLAYLRSTEHFWYREIPTKPVFLLKNPLNRRLGEEGMAPL